jgi:glycine hydroxymethyltransferase
MERVAEWVVRALDNMENETELAAIKGEVREMCMQFPLYAHLLK